MFNFLKRIIGSKSGKTEDIPFSVIEVWLDKKIKENDLEGSLTESFDRISDSLKIITGSLKELFFNKNAEIPEDSEIATPEELQELKEEYIGKLKKILTQLALPQQISMSSAIEYNESLVLSLKDMYSLDSSYEVIKETYSEQAEVFDSALSDLAEAQKKLSDTIHKEGGIMFISNVKKKIKEIQKKQKKVQELNADITREEMRKKQTEQQKLKLETEIDNLKNSDEFGKYDGMLSKKIKLQTELERENESFSKAFAPISKLLIQYEKQNLGANGYLARRYADDAVRAIKEDAKLAITDILKNMESSLNIIEPDEKKRERLKAALSSVSREFIMKHADKLSMIKEAESMLSKQVSLNNTATKIEDIKYSLNHVNQQLDILEENKQEFQKQIAELNVESDIAELEKNLKVVAPIRIT